MRVCTVVGARPQFIKASVVSHALADEGIEEGLVHTGQHYDDEMSRRFFEELEIPDVKVNLEVGSGGHAVQTGAMMTRLEDFLLASDPYDLLLVYGDTNSTIAAALVAAKLHLPVAHVEAGLRSFTRAMPEEINRIVTDRLSQLLFCPSDTAVANLAKEGITQGVFNTGDVMYDALVHFLPKAQSTYRLESVVPFRKGEYYLATIHRAENTDDPTRLAKAVDMLGRLDLPTVWPVHPRAAKCLEEFGIGVPDNIRTLRPSGYLEMLTLLEGTRAVLTDSGGLQKEAFWMGKQCVTLRAETEWIETCNGGWNTLTDLDVERVISALASQPATPVTFAYGTGDAAKRISAIIMHSCRSHSSG